MEIFASFIHSFIYFEILPHFLLKACHLSHPENAANFACSVPKYRWMWQTSAFFFSFHIFILNWILMLSDLSFLISSKSEKPKRRSERPPEKRVEKKKGTFSHHLIIICKWTCVLYSPFLILLFLNLLCLFRVISRREAPKAAHRY